MLKQDLLAWHLGPNSAEKSAGLSADFPALGFGRYTGLGKVENLLQRGPPRPECIGRAISDANSGVGEFEAIPEQEQFAS